MITAHVFLSLAVSSDWELPPWATMYMLFIRLHARWYSLENRNHLSFTKTSNPATYFCSRSLVRRSTICGSLSTSLQTELSLSGVSSLALCSCNVGFTRGLDCRPEGSASVVSSNLSRYDAGFFSCQYKSCSCLFIIHLVIKLIICQSILVR